MRNWDISTLDVPPHNPTVLDSEEEGRAIVINLPSGERLQEHQVHERAWLLVVTGSIEISDSDGESIKGGPGLLAVFDPNERREVLATDDARLLCSCRHGPARATPASASAFCAFIDRLIKYSLPRTRQKERSHGLERDRWECER